MADRPSQKMTNQEKQDFPVDAILVGGDSMDGGNSLQFQIKQSPVDALWNPQIKWPNYRTSAYGQLAFNAQALARIEANQAADRAILQQILSAVTTGAPVVIDYARIEQAIADNMPTFEIVPVTKEN